MNRLHIIAAATLASVLACSDSEGPTAPGTRSPPTRDAPPPALATITGRVIVGGSTESRTVDIRTEDGTLVRLAGVLAARLATVDGADVVVRGTWDANPGLVVQDFEVTGMHGRPALDGILELTTGGYALRLANGELCPVTGLSADVAEYVGARLWVIGSDDDPPAMFGVIGES